MDDVAKARAQLAAMRQSLAGLKVHQARLAAECRSARQNEAQLKQQLADLLQEADQVKLKRKDIECLFYSDEGWGDWEEQFRRQVSAAKRDIPPPMSPPALQELRLAGTELRLCSRSPLMLWAPHFCTEEECAQLIDLGFKTCKRHNSEAQQMQRPAVGTQEELRGVATASLEVEDLPPEHRRLMAEMQRRVAELTGVPVHQHEINPFLKFDQPAGQDLQGDDLSIGLHMDVNGGFPFCVCSVIIYLNDVEQGGRTVFPCTDLRCRELGCQLARAGHTHTSHSSASGEAADLVRLAGEEGLRISPRAGAALWFFSLGDAGEVDGSSWHGGAAVGGHLGKWTLQIFKEVPLPQRTDLGAFCAALRRRAAGLATADLTSLD
ncbi:unnamed protein product [Effrenium voratum]|uniref:Prolyl 4-hydroxylase alpha subunit domain-containing protein n=1 Tax=Effrenium voratum TaxID=2562239 RepID=A0AA36N7G4_9DINO|nr:unnamed protein product [Effrenium voratum]CAJ1429817.1 unnamed protein product [Effrenium voratum]